MRLQHGVSANSSTASNAVVTLNKDGSVRKTPGRKSLKLLRSNNSLKIIRSKPINTRSLPVDGSEVLRPVITDVIVSQNQNQFSMNNNNSISGVSNNSNNNSSDQTQVALDRMMKTLADSVTKQMDRFALELTGMRNLFLNSDMKSSVETNADGSFCRGNRNVGFEQIHPEVNLNLNANHAANFPGNVLGLREPMLGMDYNRYASSAYKMKLSKFEGKEEEDYDVWFSDVEAFFKLYQFPEHEKVRIMNANLGGEARKYVHGLEDCQYDSVAKLSTILKAAFSERINWNDVLNNSKQKSEESIKCFARRLKIAGRKCDLNGKSLDSQCLSILKKNALPYIVKLLLNCMPDVTFDTAVDYAIQYERNAGEQEKKQFKRKYEYVDQIDDSDSFDDSKDSMRTMLKRQKEEFTNTNKQIKDTIRSVKEQVCQISKASESSINNDKFRSNRSDETKDRTKSKFGLFCYHCGHGGHRYTDCKNATQKDIKTISKELKERKFDFKEWKERIAKLGEQKHSLNSDTPSTST